jgi:hypothetical protein
LATGVPVFVGGRPAKAVSMASAHGPEANAPPSAPRRDLGFAAQQIHLLQSAPRLPQHLSMYPRLLHFPRGSAYPAVMLRFRWGQQVYSTPRSEILRLRAILSSKTTTLPTFAMTRKPLHNQQSVGLTRCVCTKYTNLTIIGESHNPRPAPPTRSALYSSMILHSPLSTHRANAGVLTASASMRSLVHPV